MPIHLEGFDCAQRMRVGVANNRSLYILTGIARFNWHRTDDDSWAEDTLDIAMVNFPGRPNIPRDRWRERTAVVSLASFYSRETAARDKIGFGVNHAEPYPPSEGFGGSDYGIHVRLSILGNDVRFYRVSFQLTIEVQD